MQEVQLTLKEACEVLSPALTEHQLRHIIRALGWQPAGWRHDGQPHHPRATYNWGDLCRLHAALTPWLKG